MNEKEFADSVLAKLFGIPECCVKFYRNASGDELRRSTGLAGGIRLCPSCVKVSKFDYIKKINKNRICSKPYPEHPEETDMDVILNDTKFSQKECAWLKENKHRFVNAPDEYEIILNKYNSDLELLRKKYEAKICGDSEENTLYSSLYKMDKLEVDGDFLEKIYNKLKNTIIEQYQKGLI